MSTPRKRALEAPIGTAAAKLARLEPAIALVAHFRRRLEEMSEPYGLDGDDIYILLDGEDQKTEFLRSLASNPQRETAFNKLCVWCTEQIQRLKTGPVVAPTGRGIPAVILL